MRARFSEAGAPPEELWGAGGDKPRRQRGEAAKARRLAKRKAKALRMPLKAYLRQAR